MTKGAERGFQKVGKLHDIIYECPQTTTKEDTCHPTIFQDILTSFELCHHSHFYGKPYGYMIYVRVGMDPGFRVPGFNPGNS